MLPALCLAGFSSRLGQVWLQEYFAVCSEVAHQIARKISPQPLLILQRGKASSRLPIRTPPPLCARRFQPSMPKTFSFLEEHELPHIVVPRLIPVPGNSLRRYSLDNRSQLETPKLGVTDFRNSVGGSRNAEEPTADSDSGTGN